MNATKNKVYLFTFMHGIKRKEFGPYRTAIEAANAFQFKYGYWPEPAVKQEEYFPISNVKVVDDEN